MGVEEAQKTTQQAMVQFSDTELASRSEEQLARRHGLPPLGQAENEVHANGKGAASDGDEEGGGAVAGSELAATQADDDQVDAAEKGALVASRLGEIETEDTAVDGVRRSKTTTESNLGGEKTIHHTDGSKEIETASGERIPYEDAFD